MATTTPNYGWDVPTSTDYVKDGATAIETLGDDIDASLFGITGGKNVGLVHINTTSFTSQSTIQFNNVFTSAYDNYLLEIQCVGSTAITNLLRLSASGTPVVGTGYSYAQNYISGTTIGGFAELGIGHVAVGTCRQTTTLTNMTIFNPAKASATGFLYQNGSWNGTTQQMELTNGIHSTATAYDGFAIITNTGTITGSIRVYGYRN
jgi:hypothetical protein